MSIPFSLNDPLFRSLLLPFAASIFAIAVIRLLLGEGKGAILSNAGIGIGILMGILAIFGWPGWPADDIVGKAAWLVLAGIAVGVATDRFQLALPFAMLLLISWPVLTLLWFIAPELAHLISGQALIRLGGLIIGAVILFVRLDQEQDHGQHAPLLLLWCGVALGGMAYVYNLGRVAELAAVVAASVAGYLAWNVPVTRYPIGHAAILSAGTILIALATALIALHDGADLGLMLVVAILFAERIAALVMRRPATMLTLNVGAGIPAALAVLIAFFTK